MALHFSPLPATDLPAPTPAEIGAELKANGGAWAVVYRADRLARAETFAARVNDGKTYGKGYDAVVRKVGAECQVWATFSH
jgi:hypothetical protein